MVDEVLDPGDMMYTVTGAYGHGEKVEPNEIGRRGYLRATSPSAPTPRPGYCASWLAEVLGIDSPGDAYQWPRNLLARGWKMREGYVAPYDIICYHNRKGSTYRGYSKKSKRYFGHVGIAVPTASGELMLLSNMNGEICYKPLGKGWVAMYKP